MAGRAREMNLRGEATGWEGRIRCLEEDMVSVRALLANGKSSEAMQKKTVFELPTVSGPAIIAGVPSASEAVEGDVPAARYNEYRIGRSGGGWRCEMAGRSVAAAPEHVWESERRVLRER